jgi:hypothetical protein
VSAVTSATGGQTYQAAEPSCKMQKQDIRDDSKGRRLTETASPLKPDAAQSLQPTGRVKKVMAAQARMQTMCVKASRRAESDQQRLNSRMVDEALQHAPCALKVWRDLPGVAKLAMVNSLTGHVAYGPPFCLEGQSYHMHCVNNLCTYRKLDLLSVQRS